MLSLGRVEQRAHAIVGGTRLRARAVYEAGLDAAVRIFFRPLPGSIVPQEVMRLPIELPIEGRGIDPTPWQVTTAGEEPAVTIQRNSRNGRMWPDAYQVQGPIIDKDRWIQPSWLPLQQKGFWGIKVPPMGQLEPSLGQMWANGEGAIRRDVPSLGEIEQREEKRIDIDAEYNALVREAGITNEEIIAAKEDRGTVDPIWVVVEGRVCYELGLLEGKKVVLNRGQKQQLQDILGIVQEEGEEYGRFDERSLVYKMLMLRVIMLRRPKLHEREEQTYDAMLRNVVEQMRDQQLPRDLA